MSLQLVFFLFFSCYFCSVVACVVCIVFVRSNQSSSVLFYVVFQLLYRCFDAILNAGESSSSFFSLHIQSTSSPGYKPYTLSWVCVLRSIFWSSSLAHFENGTEYLTRGGAAQVFIPLMRFLQYSLVFRCFLVLLGYSFLNFFFYIHLFDGVRFQYSQVSFFFSERSDFVLIC